MGSVQENGRFALDYINLTARSAEYSNAIGSTESGIITDASELPLGAAITNKDAFISRGSFTALGAGNSDQLVVRQWVSLNMPNFTLSFFQHQRKFRAVAPIFGAEFALVLKKEEGVETRTDFEHDIPPVAAIAAVRAAAATRR